MNVSDMKPSSWKEHMLVFSLHSLRQILSLLKSVISARWVNNNPLLLTPASSLQVLVCACVCLCVREGISCFL